MRDSKPADNVLADEFCAFTLSDCEQRLGLYPLSEVINYNDSELRLSTGGQEWYDQVNAPLCERPRANN